MNQQPNEFSTANPSQIEFGSPRDVDVLAKVKRRVEAKTETHQSSLVGEQVISSPLMTQDDAPEVGSIIPPVYKAYKLTENFVVRQKWEGYITDISDDVFTARLRSLSGAADKLEAEIYLDELDQDDRRLVEPGAIFYWSIGYLDGPSGRRRTSIIRFKRVPLLTDVQLADIESRASELSDLLSDAL